MQVRSTLVGIALGALLGGAGFAFASVPSSNGVIHACYDRANGYRLRVLDTAKQAKCPAGQTQLVWNHAGVPGVAGQPGTNGTDGQDGLDGQDGIDGQDGTTVAARLRTTTPFLSGTWGTPTPNTDPAPNGWTQQADEIDTFYGEIAITAPASCSYYANTSVAEPDPTVTVQIMLLSPAQGPNVAQVSLKLHPGQSKTVTLGPGGDVGTIPLFEPASTTDHTVLLHADSNCGKPTEQYSIDSVKLDVVRMR